LRKATKKGERNMLERLVRGLREYVVILSILLLIGGLFFFLMGLFEYTGLQAYQISVFKIGQWNAYILVFGLIVLSIGIYYLYSFFKKRKFVLDELKTDKRSELLKKRNKLESTVKHLPSKYEKMLVDKEDEFNIK